MARNAPPPFTLSGLIRREKLYGYSSVAGTIGVLLLIPMVFALFALMTDRSGPQNLLCCCAIPLVPLGIVAAALIGKYFAPVLTGERLQFLLASYGSAEAIIPQIDRELVADGSRWTRGSTPRTFRGKFSRSTMVTQSWLVNFDQSDFWIVAIPDVLWAFKRISALKTWSGERLLFQVCCVMNVDRIYFLPMPNESWADDTFGAIVERRPEILVGYRGEWRDLAAAGRKALRAEVERRRASWNQLDADGRDEWLDQREDEAESFVRRVDPNAPDDGGVTIPRD